MNVPSWIELAVAVLLALSGIFSLVSAFGFLRLPTFFLRMHPPALAYTFASWCVALASVLYFSALLGKPALHPLLIPALLAVTVPVTTVVLARVALFRQRLADEPGTPPPLTGTLPPASRTPDSDPPPASP